MAWFTFRTSDRPRSAGPSLGAAGLLIGIIVFGFFASRSLMWVTDGADALGTLSGAHCSSTRTSGSTSRQTTCSATVHFSAGGDQVMTTMSTSGKPPDGVRLPVCYRASSPTQVAQGTCQDQLPWALGWTFLTAMCGLTAFGVVLGFVPASWFHSRVSSG